MELGDHPLLRRLFPPLLECLRPCCVRRPDRSDRLRQQLVARHEPVSSHVAGYAFPTGALALLAGTFPAARRRFSLGERPAQRRTGRAAGRPSAVAACSAGRCIFWIFTRRRIPRKKKSYQKDQGLAGRTPYRLPRRGRAGWTPADGPRLKKLYDDLYPRPEILPLQSAVYRGVLPGAALGRARLTCCSQAGTRGDGSTACSGSWSGRG